jgi:hypothetical protein
VLLWILAGLVVLGVLIWLGVALVRTWKTVVVVSSRMAQASERMADAAAGLEAANAAQHGRPTL